MSDFSDLKKKVDAFINEVKTFSSSLKSSDEADNQQQRYIELRDKKKEFMLEVKNFEPAKKIFRLDSKKSSILKSLQDEITKAEKAMIKQNIEVPADEEMEELEESTDKKGKKKKTEDQKDEGKTKGKKEKKEAKKSKDDKKATKKEGADDGDSKSVTSAKSKKSEIENDFEDTEDEEVEEEPGIQVEEDEEEDDQVEKEDRATTKKGEVIEKEKTDKDKKSKDKKKDKSEDKKKEKDSSKKKLRKESEKSAAPDEDTGEAAENGNQDDGESKKSKESKKKNDKADKKSKNTKEMEEEVEDEEEDEAATSDKKKDKKEKRKSKEVQSKEDEDKKKGKDAEESKEDKKKKDKKKGKDEDESKEDKKDKKNKKSKDADDKKKDKKPEAKEDEADQIAEVAKELRSERTVQTAASDSGRQQSQAEAQDEFDDEEEEEEEEDELPSEQEDGGATYEMIMTQQATQVQSATPAPTPAPRQNEDAKPTTSERTTRVATGRLGEPSAPALSAVGQLEDDAEEFEEEDEQEEEDDEDEESGYDYENMRTLGPNEPSSYEVLQSYTEDDPEMLPIQKGELLVVLKVGPDGWWLARNARGREGLVPCTLIRLAPEDEEDGDEEEDQGSEFEDVTQVDSQSAGAQLPNELTRTGETEEYESDDDAEYEDEELTADGHEKMVAESQQPPPGMPSGFRISTLARWFYQGTKRYPGRQFTLQSLLHPKLSASCMALQDGWGCAPQARPVSTRIEKLVHLQKCLAMPTGLPTQVLDRFVRLCLFDGQGPVSNVHTVRATVAAKDERTWSFGTRASDTSPSLDYGELYLRYNFGQNNVQLLLEATVVCKGETSEPIELSIGHVMVPLFDENGGPLPAKTLDLQLEGGTPFDRQQDVDSKLGQSGTQSKAQARPRFQLKLSMPNKETKEFMDLLPTTILGNLANLQLHSLYRQVLASELSLSNQAIEHGANAIYAPHLVQFPAMADQPDLMDVLRRRWNEFAKRDRAFRKPAASEVMKQEFIRIVKSTYFISQMKDFQPYAFGNKAHEQFRASAIQDFLRKIGTDQSAINFSLSSDLIFEPFSIEEVALPMIGQFSVPVLPAASD